MLDSTPHYLLSSDVNRLNGSGYWHFELRTVDNAPHFEAGDVEPGVWGERLDLLTVVRALESLDRPSWVTVVACSRYVEQGLQFGVPEWRANGWRWEAFGQLVPVRDADLWQRLERILQFHRVECAQRRLDAGHALLSGPHWESAPVGESPGSRLCASDWLKCTVPALVLFCGAWLSAASRFWHAISGLGSLLMLHRS